MSLLVNSCIFPCRLLTGQRNTKYMFLLIVTYFDHVYNNATIKLEETLESIREDQKERIWVIKNIALLKFCYQILSSLGFFFFLFNGISTFVGYLMLNPSFQKNSCPAQIVRLRICWLYPMQRGRIPTKNKLPCWWGLEYTDFIPSEG